MNIDNNKTHRCHLNAIGVSSNSGQYRQAGETKTGINGQDIKCHVTDIESAIILGKDMCKISTVTTH